MSGGALARKRGKGSKSPEERRRRTKNLEEAKPPVVVRPVDTRSTVGAFEWRVKGERYVSPSEARHPAARAVRSAFPSGRSLEEVVLVGRGIRPSGPLPMRTILKEVNELERLRDERLALEAVREKLEQHEKRLVLVLTRIDRAEERIGKAVAGLERVEGVVQSFSTLMAQMEDLLTYFERRRRP